MRDCFKCNIKDRQNKSRTFAEIFNCINCGRGSFSTFLMTIPSLQILCLSLSPSPCMRGCLSWMLLSSFFLSLSVVSFVLLGATLLLVGLCFQPSLFFALDLVLGHFLWRFVQYGYRKIYHLFKCCFKQM